MKRKPALRAANANGPKTMTGEVDFAKSLEFMV